MSAGTQIAIVGAGPKGTFALERLLERLAAVPAHSRAASVRLFDPHPEPGAGHVYASGQPDELLMNFAAGHVDMWPVGESLLGIERRSYVAWSRDDPVAYPPRSRVGSYLAAGLRALIAAAPQGVRVEVVRARVVELSTAGGAWELRDDGGRHWLADEVLLATGHERGGAAALGRDWRHAVRLVPEVFPVGERLSLASVPPGAVVAIRGFALTFLDAALTLTEGRGGRFDAGSYVAPPGLPDVTLYPYSRSGRPLLPKPPPGRTPPGLGELLAVRRDAVMALEPGFNVAAELEPLLAHAAADALALDSGERATEPELVDELVQALATLLLDDHPGPGEPRAAIVRALAIGAGQTPADPHWALGEAWRGLYPAFVARLSDGGVNAAQWSRLARLGAELERLAFGSPAQTAAKLVALIDAGVVRTDHLAGGTLEDVGGRTLLRSPGRDPVIVDIVIDAVLAPPGVAGFSPGENPLLAGLLSAGHARIATGRRGIETSADARCIGVDGAPSPGLAALGRPTEDWVIGNDTLSRTLHPHADRWARGVVGRLAARRPAGLSGTVTI